MAAAFFSNQWYRVAKLRPRLRPNVISSRHYYRGVTWYVLTSTSNPATLRLDSSAFHLLSSFDGEKKVDEVWEGALEVLGDDSPTQDETVSLLADLFDAGLVDFQQRTDVERLFENARSRQQKEAISRYMNPLFMRFSLLDPDQLAQRVIPYTSWMFTRTTFLVWLLFMLTGALLGGFHFEAIGEEMRSGLLSPTSLVIFWCVFPVMKVLHEAAHALAVKRWGGEVHEFGIALLVLMPVPYVDASESARFANKHRRMAVAGAGILVESSLAFLGFVLWTLVEPGLVRDIAFNVFVTGSVSSLLFNGNPLLKFDAYYVLSDLIEIPNLATRSSRFLTHLLKKYVLGVSSHSPVVARGEAFWFSLYGIAAFCYRIVLMVTISLFVASKYFFIGILLALWSIGMQVGMPLVKALRFLLTDPTVQGERGRAWGAAGGLAAGVLVLVFLVPMSSSTSVRGVVWPVDDAMVRAEADCLAMEVFVANGEAVTPGTELVRCDDTYIEAEVRNLESDFFAARARLFSTRDRVERGLRRSEMETAESLLETARAEQEGVRLDANADGSFFAHDNDNLVGRFFAQGDIVGYVLRPGNLSVRTMLDQERAALLDEGDGIVELTLASEPGITYRTEVLRRVPAASFRLVSPALGVAGGGDLVSEPGDNGTEKLREAAFEVEVELPLDLKGSLVGAPVEVRFEHGAATIAGIVSRELRLLFLRQFDV